MRCLLLRMAELFSRKDLCFLKYLVVLLGVIVVHFELNFSIYLLEVYS